MWTHGKIEKICLGAIALAVMITILFMNAEALGLEMVVDQDCEKNAGSVYFTANDLTQQWDIENATRITLSSSGPKVSGHGAYVYEKDVYIRQSGFYQIKGECEESSIIVNASADSKVWLLMDGVDMSCMDDACIRIEQADKVFLNLGEGTVNTLHSGSAYSASAIQDGVDGALFSRDDLTINGKGTLHVSTAYWHGIVVNDELVISGGTIVVDAPQDAIHVNDAFRMTGSDITLRAGDEGISVTDGWLYVASGNISIDSKDDAIHAVSDIAMDGGEIVASSWDDAIHSDTGIYVYDIDLLARNCNDGLDAPLVEIYGGSLSLRPDRDGIKALTNETGAFPHILVAGGDVEIVNKNGGHAVGLRSDGDVVVTGGTIHISFLDNGENVAMDYGEENGGVARIDGGVVVACGSHAMAQSFGKRSTQCSILYNIKDSIPGETTVSLEDNKGNVLVKHKVPYAFSSMIISCPAMVLSRTYSVVIGEWAEKVTLRETSASFGNAKSEMFEGPMHYGGLSYRGKANTAQKNPRPSASPMPTDTPERHVFPRIGENKETSESQNPISEESWWLLGASFVSLSAGILFAARFEEKLK